MKHSRDSQLFVVKVTKIQRADGKSRFRVNVPLKIATSSKRIEGTFVFLPETQQLAFDLLMLNKKITTTETTENE